MTMIIRSSDLVMTVVTVTVTVVTSVSMFIEKSSLEESVFQDRWGGQNVH